MGWRQRGLALLLAAAKAGVVRPSGIGPVGAAVVDGRYVLVSDKLENAVLLVDIALGVTVGRRDLDCEPHYRPGDSSTYQDLTGIATCTACDFAYVATNRDGKLYRVQFSGPLSHVAKQSNTTDLAAIMSSATLHPVPSASRDALSEPRMIAIDALGIQGFIADHKNGAVFRFNPGNDSGMLSKVLDKKEATSVSLWQLDPAAQSKLLLVVAGGKNSNILVADAKDGKEFATMGGCSHQGHGRDALIDPYSNSLLYLTHPANKGGIICEEPLDSPLKISSRALRAETDASPHHADKNHTQSQSREYGGNSQHGECHVLAGNKMDGSGWRDGFGTAAHFSRPHAMILLPYPHQALLLTDIDNRALRIVDLAPASRRGQVTTVLYSSRDVSMTKFPNPRPRHEVQESGSAGEERQKMTSHGAAQVCSQRGLQLCSPAQWTNYSFEGTGEHDQVWTSRLCASCWISSSVFKESDDGSSWTSCSQGGHLYKNPVTSLPVFARDNLHDPGGWNSGRVAVQVHQTTSDEVRSVRTSCISHGEKREFRCCAPAESKGLQSSRKKERI